MKRTAIMVLLAGGLIAAPALADGPDAVTIGALSHWFEPVAFQHGVHVDLVADCQACHHDQEPDEIVSCGSCHAADYDPGAPDVPDLKMAFHRQCVGCHQDQGAPVACTDCHGRKALPGGPELGAGAVR